MLQTLHAGAFFLWIVYAIGAQLMANPENPPEVSKWLMKRKLFSDRTCQFYYARASNYLQPVLQMQDIRTVQALLALVQYHFRDLVRYCDATSGIIAYS